MQAPGATLIALLRDGGESIPLDMDLVGPERCGGPLARFLQERRARALDLYLLLSAATSGRHDAVTFPSAVWARALGIDDIASPDVQISRNWSWLEGEGLVSTERQGRLRAVRLVAVSRSVEAVGERQDRRVFAVPTAYFVGNFHNRINLAGKVVLLAGLARGGRFSFVSGPPSSWHGLTRDTVKRGIRVLMTLGLLRAESTRIVDPMTAGGYRVERRYTLQPPFTEAPGQAARARR